MFAAFLTQIESEVGNFIVAKFLKMKNGTFDHAHHSNHTHYQCIIILLLMVMISDEMHNNEKVQDCNVFP